MLRIGMIGADNFHALAFSRLANLPPEEGGSGLPARVTLPGRAVKWASSC